MSNDTSQMTEDSVAVDGTNILVIVRVRPSTEMEMLRPDLYTIVKVMDQHVLSFNPISTEHSNGGRHNPSPSVGKSSKDIQYAFDRVFSSTASQEEVYAIAARPLLTHLLGGGNATVFAYGATGAGKTHTMQGTPESPGVMVLAMRELFDLIQKESTSVDVRMSISYLEIYNETIRDLLSSDSHHLDIREDPNKGMVVSGLSEHHPTNASHLLQLLAQGNLRRSQSPTEANAQSSRSHAVFQVYLEVKDKNAGIKGIVKNAKLSLVDLAGSERAAVTKNKGERLIEGANINRSLLALGNCINALGEQRKNNTNSNRHRKHIPYRDSKLTRLLKDSLGGTCRTVMICNISPCSLVGEDTLNSLKYANRAKNIRVFTKKQIHQVNYHVSQYTDIIERLTGQVTELTKQLIVLQEQGTKEEAEKIQGNGDFSTVEVMETPNKKRKKENYPMLLLKEYKDKKMEKALLEDKRKQLKGAIIALQWIGNNQTMNVTIDFIKSALQSTEDKHDLISSELKKMQCDLINEIVDDNHSIQLLMDIDCKDIKDDEFLRDLLESAMALFKDGIHDEILPVENEKKLAWRTPMRPFLPNGHISPKMMMLSPVIMQERMRMEMKGESMLKTPAIYLEQDESSYYLSATETMTPAAKLAQRTKDLRFQETTMLSEEMVECFDENVENELRNHVDYSNVPVPAMASLDE